VVIFDNVLKNLMDYSFSALILVLLAPLFAVIALAIKLDSHGPVFYRRRVMGRGGRTFDAFKFRTMVADADTMLAEHPEWAMERTGGRKNRDDPRLTRLGRRLRKYSLNELPQLINVLLGHMSLVGPRMVTPAEVEGRDQWRAALVRVKPGLTGLWQISGRNDLDLEERIRLDIHYVTYRNILMDIGILLKTIPAVLRGKNAF
jgi:lipopolysaccharide/colanic/teichoic acid biosynthesis glycosyltransferase